MGADQFTVENGLAAQALQAATVAPIANEAWADGDALLYSATDGKLHPVPVQPLAGAIVSVSGVAPLSVSPGVAPIVSLSGVVDVAHGGTSSATGDASLLTNIPAAQLAGDVALARLATALATGGDSIKGTILTATTRLDAPSVGASSATQHALPTGTGDLVSADASQVLTNKAISGSDNTLSNIGNASLTNSSVTVTASTGLSGGGAVALGGSTSISMPNVGTANTYAYPSSLTTDAQGRLSSVTAGSAPAALPLSRANGGLGSDVSALSTGLLAQTASNTWAVRSVAPGTGISVSNGDGVAGNPTVSVDSTVATLTGSQVLTNKTMSGASNTFSSIGNSSLTNSSLTVSAGTGLTGGGSVALGASTSLAVSYGTTAGTAAQGNDARLPPAPSSAGRMLYDNASAWTALAAGTTSQVLVGGSAPVFGSVPAAAITALTGTITGTYTLGGTPSLAASALTGTVSKAQGGFGQSVATGLTYGQGVYVDSSGVLQIGNIPQDKEFFLEMGNAAASTTTVTCYSAGHPVAQASAAQTLPSFCAAAAGSVFGLQVNLDGGGFGAYLSAVAAGDTITVKVQRSTNEGTSWSDLTGSAVQCSLTAGTSSGSDLTHTGTFSAGDWISVSAVGTSAVAGYRGGIKIKVRYS